MKKNNKHLSLRIDEALLRKFEYATKYADRSMNWMLLNLVRKYVTDFEKKHGEIPNPPTES